MAYGEKRLGKRSVCQEPVKIENCETGEIVAATLYNYSMTGFYFEADLPMVPGTKVRLFSGRDNLKPGLRDVRGKVRWYQEIDAAVVLHGYGYGAEFDRPLAQKSTDRRFRVIQGGISKNAIPKTRKSKDKRGL